MEVNSRTSFQPSLIAAMKISRDIFQQLRTNDIQLTKQPTPEYLDYYHAFCVWARIIHIKNKNQVSLTQEEEWFLEITWNREYSLLEHMSTYLRGIGNITTIIGQHLYPSFPQLPTATVGGKTGFYGPIDADNHNLYEEIPCFGVLAEAIQYAVSNAQPGVYPIVLSTQTASVNQNLLGYQPLQSRTNEAKDLAYAINIGPDEFEESRPGTSINIGLINAISDILATTKTFRIAHISFPSLSVNGSQSQIIITKRTDDTSNRPDVRSEVQPQCLIKENEAHFGAAVFAAYQLEKSLPIANWLCITPTNPADLIYVPFILNRNQRRDLPDHYKAQVFVTNKVYSSKFLR